MQSPDIWIDCSYYGWCKSWKKISGQVQEMEDNRIRSKERLVVRCGHDLKKLAFVSLDK
jgi:hypothetical protein